jgi:MoxR-like ATPase
MFAFGASILRQTQETPDPSSDPTSDHLGQRQTGSATLAVQAFVEAVKTNVQRVVVGKGDGIDLALIALLCGGHVLIEDVPGIGKTTLARALADSLGCTFKRIQFTPDLMPADVLGVNFFNQKTGDFQFRAGPVFSQVLVADEINRATPRTQSALLEAMQERQATIDGETMPLPDPFLVLATQNPVELEGTFPLPEAQLDRFMVRVELGYPTEAEEKEIFLRFDDPTGSPEIGPVTDADGIATARQAVPEVRVDAAVRDYVAQVTRATRDHEGVELGASPRAGLALYKTSQARAALMGRDYVLPDDVKAMAAPVLAHRMIMGASSRLRGVVGRDIVAEVLAAVSVPIELDPASNSGPPSSGPLGPDSGSTGAGTGG